MIKSILGGKSKNLCDVAYLLTLPVDKTFQNRGYWRVLINAEPNTTYTFSRENADRITDLGNTYLAISAYDDISHNNWLSHHAVQSLNNKSATLTTSSDGKLWILFGQNVYTNYWQKNLNPFGYIQLELGSTATEYVPHELTSYKSIMKVSDGRFVTSFDERMPCKTKNLFDPYINLWKAEISALNYDNGIYYTKDYASRIIDLTNVDTDYQLSFQIKHRDRGTEYAYDASWKLLKDNEVIYYGKGSDSETFVKLSYTLALGSTYTLLIYNSIYLGYVQLEKGTTATDYVPYGYV